MQMTANLAHIRQASVTLCRSDVMRRECDLYFDALENTAHGGDRVRQESVLESDRVRRAVYSKFPAAQVGRGRRLFSLG